MQRKTRTLEAHDRIVGLASRDKTSATPSAVKWLGNVGSHSDEITQDDALDAFDIG
jgi:hypothetical protein